MQIKKLIAVMFAVALLAVGFAVPASPASAQQEADGLVVVQVKNVKDVVDVGVAANTVVQLCGVNLDVALGIIADIDEGDIDQHTFCRTDTGKVQVKQN